MVIYASVLSISKTVTVKCRVYDVYWQNQLCVNIPKVGRNVGFGTVEDLGEVLGNAGL